MVVPASTKSWERNLTDTASELATSNSMTHFFDETDFSLPKAIVSEKKKTPSFDFEQHVFKDSRNMWKKKIFQRRERESI